MHLYGKIWEIDASKNVEPRIKGVHWCIFAEMPGMFPKGSTEDHHCLAQIRNRESVEKPAPEGVWFERKIFGGNEISPWSSPLKAEDDEATLKHNHGCDIESMIELDARLRVCRAILSRQFYLAWDFLGGPVWAVSNPPSGDPLDYIAQEFGLDTPDRDICYFALKALRHYRRYEKIAENGELASNPSVMRELILFGETFATARAAIALGLDVKTGAPVRAGTSKGGLEKARLVTNPIRDAVLREMRRLMLSKPQESVAWAAQQAHKNGFGKSSEANRRAYYRHYHKDNL